MGGKYIRWDWLHVTMAKSQHGGGGGRESRRHFGEWKEIRAGLAGGENDS
jgi:hypothetical protein